MLRSYVNIFKLFQYTGLLFLLVSCLNIFSVVNIFLVSASDLSRTGPS